MIDFFKLAKQNYDMNLYSIGISFLSTLFLFFIILPIFILGQLFNWIIFILLTLFSLFCPLIFKLFYDNKITNIKKFLFIDNYNELSHCNFTFLIQLEKLLKLSNQEKTKINIILNELYNQGQPIKNLLNIQIIRQRISNHIQNCNIDDIYHIKENFFAIYSRLPELQEKIKKHEHEIKEKIKEEEKNLMIQQKLNEQQIIEKIELRLKDD